VFEAIKRGDPDGARTAFRVLLTRSETDAMSGIRIMDEGQ
jgi:DNA-binding FadR family transcriptional regulator